MEDYKEKYEQALERAKICYKDLSNLYGVVATMSKDFFEEVFPELKESEDDRVRKSIIGFLKTIASLKDGKTVSNEDFDSEALLEWAAWLEKQGKKFQYWEPSEEQLGALDYAYNLCPDTERGNYYEGVLETLIDALHKLSEKQGEQKQHLELKAGHWYFCHQAYCERADILIVKEGETFKCEKDGIVKGLIIKEPEKYFREISTPTDKVEPKFKVGDCIINSEGMLRHILSVDKTGYQTDYGWLTHDIYDNTYHLWTIQDAKDGDVLYECNEKKPFIFKALKTKHIGDIASYCDIFNGIFNPNEDNWTTLDIVPATKGQRDILFQKMKKAGYEWDAEKKELKKIEPKLINEYNEHELTAYETKKWNEAYEKGYEIGYMNGKNEQKPAWSEDDEKMINDIIEVIDKEYVFDYQKIVNWLKSLKERYTWKPTNEQMEALLKLEEMHVLEHENNQENAHLYMVIKNIREQLLKLKGE